MMLENFKSLIILLIQNEASLSTFSHCMLLCLRFIAGHLLPYFSNSEIGIARL